MNRVVDRFSKLSCEETRRQLLVGCDAMRCEGRMREKNRGKGSQLPILWMSKVKRCAYGWLFGLSTCTPRIIGGERTGVHGGNRSLRVR